VESSQLFARVGQQLLGAVNDPAVSGTSDLSALLVGMECREPKASKLLENCK